MNPMYALWTAALMSVGGPVTEVAVTPEDQQTSVLITVVLLLI